MSLLAPIEEVNGLDRAAFSRALRPLFEASGPLADALYARRPFASYAALIDSAEGVAATLPRAEQVDVVNAHPKIGESAALVRQTSEQSYREQGYEREAALDQAEVARTYERLRGLNQQYEERFGFRFVVFVNGRSKAEIAEVLARRLVGEPDDELRTALHDMLEIARDRLRKLA